LGGIGDVAPCLGGQPITTQIRGFGAFTQDFYGVSPVLIDDLSGDLLDQPFIVFHKSKTTRQNPAFRS
jgi:hypothetical protein